MKIHSFRIVAILILLSPAAFAQVNKTPDTLIFSNGEQLSGELEKANADGITFKSPVAGELTVKWANIKQLHSDKNFAILTKNEKLTRKRASAVVPQGTVSVEDKQLTVATSSGPRTIPLADANLLVDAAAFDKAVNHPPNFMHGWGGTAAAGASLVRATQNSTTFTGAVSLTRAIPLVDWLPPRSRTTLDYNQAYGTVSQAATPTLKTNIFHAEAEQDEYLSSRLFAFASATFDHNFAQSLELQQAYGGGLGISVFHNAIRQLDVKGDVHYEKQSFFNSALNQNLIGSTFSERYLQFLPKGIVFNEFASVSPAWNNTNAYSAHANANLGFPVYKGFGFNIGAVDDYLNNAPAGFKKNSTQFTTGITYTIKPN